MWKRSQLHCWPHLLGTFDSEARRDLAARQIMRLAAIARLLESTVVVLLVVTLTILEGDGDYATQESCH